MTFPGVGSLLDEEVVDAEEVDLAVVVREIVGDLAGEEVPDEGVEVDAEDLAVVREEADVTVGVEVFLVEAIVGEGPRGEAVGVEPTDGGEVGRELTTDVTERERVAEGEAGTAVGEANADLLPGLDAVVTVMEGRGEAVDVVVVVLGEEVGVRTLVVVALRAGVGLDALALEGALVVGEEGEAAARAEEGAELGPEKVEAIAEMAGETVEGERARRVRVVEAAEAEAGE